MKIDVNKMFTEEERAELHTVYDSLRKRVLSGESGNKITRDIDEFYRKIRIKVNNTGHLYTSYGNIGYLSSTDVMEFVYDDVLSDLGIPSGDKLFSIIDNKSYVYFPKPVVKIKENAVYIFMDGKEYKCVPTGRTEEQVIKEKAEEFIEEREKEKKRKKMKEEEEEQRRRDRSNYRPRESGLLDIMFG